MLIAQWVLIKHVPAVRYFAVDGWEAFVFAFGARVDLPDFLHCPNHVGFFARTGRQDVHTAC